MLTIVSHETGSNEYNEAFPTVATSVGFPQNTTKKTAGRKSVRQFNKFRNTIA